VIVARGYQADKVDQASPSGPRLVGQLRFDAGNLTLDLIATVGRRFGAPIERLTGPDRLEAWVRGVGLRLVLVAMTVDDVVRVREFREQANEVVRAALAGSAPPAQALAAVNSACAIPVTLERAADGSDVVAPPVVPTADTIIGLVARDTVVLLLGPDLRRIAECEARDCRMLYIRPPGARRVWCSSAHCGNRNRVAANYARTKARSVAAEGNR
jgi:predicted RNA-binding Zn ribbon-like protein